MRIWFQTLKRYFLCLNFTGILLLRCEKQTYRDFDLNNEFIICDTMRHSCIFLFVLLYSSHSGTFPDMALCYACAHVTKPFMLNQVFQCLNARGWFTVQGGDVVFVYKEHSPSWHYLNSPVQNCL